LFLMFSLALFGFVVIKETAELNRVLAVGSFSFQDCFPVSYSGPVNYGSTMGYRFNPNYNGQITKLCGYFSGTKWVKLYDASYTVLASSQITSSANWSCNAISPINVTSGNTYYVAVDVAGSGGYYLNFDTGNQLPKSCGNVTINASAYQSPSGTFNSGHSETYIRIYGLADIELTPSDIVCSGTAAYIRPTGAEECSSVFSSSWLCSNAHDGNTGTGWFSVNSSPKWIWFDLGEEKCISGVNVRPWSGYNNQVVNVQVSNNASSWDTAASSWTITTGGAWNEKTFTETSGRYIRLYFTSTPNSYAAIAEFQAKVRDCSYLYDTPPINDSLAFSNPSSGNIAITDGSTEWNFRVQVSQNPSYEDLDTVKLRMANYADTSSPFEDLEFTWTQVTDVFAETGNDLRGAVVLSGNSSSNCSGTTCILDFKIKINNNLYRRGTNYDAELFATSDVGLSDSDSYSGIYQVSAVEEGITTTSGNLTISENSVIEGNMGIDEGNLTIASGVTLQINPNATLTFEPGYQINKAGAIILLSANNARIVKGPVETGCAGHFYKGDCWYAAGWSESCADFCASRGGVRPHPGYSDSHLCEHFFWPYQGCIYGGCFMGGPHYYHVSQSNSFGTCYLGCTSAWDADQSNWAHRRFCSCAN